MTIYDDIKKVLKDTQNNTNAEVLFYFPNKELSEKYKIPQLIEITVEEKSFERISRKRYERNAAFEKLSRHIYDSSDAIYNEIFDKENPLNKMIFEGKLFNTTFKMCDTGFISILTPADSMGNIGIPPSELVTCALKLEQLDILKKTDSV